MSTVCLCFTGIPASTLGDPAGLTVCIGLFGCAPWLSVTASTWTGPAGSACCVSREGLRRSGGGCVRAARWGCRLSYCRGWSTGFNPKRSGRLDPLWSTARLHLAADLPATTSKRPGRLGLPQR